MKPCPRSCAAGSARDWPNLCSTVSNVEGPGRSSLTADCSARCGVNAGMLWTHKSLNNWVRNANGRVFALIPYRPVECWKLTKEFSLQDFYIS
jgi:4-hydroxyacetophenone monooxygenase